MEPNQTPDPSSEHDPIDGGELDPNQGQSPEDGLEGNRPARGAKQLTAAEAAAMFPDMQISEELLQPEQPRGVEGTFSGTVVTDDLELVDPIDSVHGDSLTAGQGGWPALDGDAGGDDYDPSTAYASAEYGEESSDHGSHVDEMAAAGASSGGGIGRWVGGGLVMVLVGAGAAIVWPRLAGEDRGPEIGDGPTRVARTDADTAVDGRRLSRPTDDVPGEETPGPSSLAAADEGPSFASEDLGPASGFLRDLFSGGDSTPIATVAGEPASVPAPEVHAPGAFDPFDTPLGEDYRPLGSEWTPLEVADDTVQAEADEEPAGLQLESIESFTDPVGPLEGEPASEDWTEFEGYQDDVAIEPWLDDPFADDAEIERELAELLAELEAEAQEESEVDAESVAEVDPPEAESSEVAAAEPGAEQAEADLEADLRALEQALAALEQDYAATSGELDRAFEVAEESVAVQAEPDTIERQTLEETADDLGERVVAADPFEDPSEPALGEEPFTDDGFEDPLEALEVARADEGAGESTEPFEPETLEVAQAEPLDLESLDDRMQALDAQPEEARPEGDVESEADAATEQAAPIGPTIAPADLEAGLAEVAALDEQAASERRSTTLGFDEQLLLPEAPGGVRFASQEDLSHVWNSTSLPEAAIHSETTLLTPAIGIVRLVCTNGEAFDGLLQSVGQSKLTLRTNLGAMTFEASAVAQIQRMDGPLPDMPHAKLPAGQEKVRVRTPGGMIVGNVLARHEGRITLMTESGGRITLPDEKVEPYSDAARGAVLGNLPGPE